MNFRTASGVENEHGYVVLDPTSGLKWAVCNIGANAPQEIGGYYAWGETAEKENYSLDGTAYFDIETDNFTKYNDTDGMFELDLTDDAAYANWDGNWRTPSQTELLELCNTNNVTWTFVNDDFRKGVIITSIINGNSIFLPITGAKQDDMLMDEGMVIYNSSSRESAMQAFFLNFNGDTNEQGQIGNVGDKHSRSIGCNIRAVFKL